jgi:glutamate racemase
VDSASTTAAAARELLESSALLNGQSGEGSLKLLATDGATRFARVGGQFLGHDLKAQDIVLTDL